MRSRITFTLSAVLLLLAACDRSEPADQPKAAHAPAPQNADSIWLKLNDNDDVTYGYSSASQRFAVFSEVFYQKGWKAYVDGKELPIVRTNYVLRGLSLPPGQNKEIKFEFRPASFYTGEKLALGAGIIVYLLLIAAAFQTYRSRMKKPGAAKS